MYYVLSFIFWLLLYPFLMALKVEDGNAFLVSILISALLSFCVKLNKESKEESKIRNHIYNCVNEHYDTLCMKRDHAIYYDDYGNEITTGFVKELIYFVENVVFQDYELDPQETLKYAQIVANMMDKVQEERPKPDYEETEEDLDMWAENSPDPYEFEGNCKKILEKAGWEARTTPKSGDQGVDVIAKKDDILIVVQCKFYRQPVGNKAVQEIAAGKTYYKADYAVVVTNSVYTKAAKQLAKSCGVVLLSIKQLKHVEDYLE